MYPMECPAATRNTSKKLSCGLSIATARPRTSSRRRTERQVRSAGFKGLPNVKIPYRESASQCMQVDPAPRMRDHHFHLSFQPAPASTCQDTQNVLKCLPAVRRAQPISTMSHTNHRLSPAVTYYFTTYYLHHTVPVPACRFPPRRTA